MFVSACSLVDMIMYDLNNQFHLALVFTTGSLLFSVSCCCCSILRVKYLILDDQRSIQFVYEVGFTLVHFFLAKLLSVTVEVFNHEVDKFTLH